MRLAEPLGNWSTSSGPRAAGQHLGQARGEPRLERGPVELLAGTDRRDLGRRLGRGRGTRQATPPWMPSTAPVVKLDALEAK